MSYQHQSVLLKEVLAILQLRAGQKIIDGTLGGGGYTRAIAKQVGEKGAVLAFDVDELAIAHAKNWLKQENLKQVTVIKGNFADLSDIVPKKFKKVDGIVLDLGLSSAQLDDPRRGFSFLREGPLSMAFGVEAKENTAVIVNKYRAEDLAAIIKDYGEEHFAKSIAQAIVAARPIGTASELVAAIGRGLPAANKRRQAIHWATRTFQALRIATNRELDNLSNFLPQAVDLLKPGGKLIIVSFHSLEDRIVKNFFRQESQACLCPKDLPVCVCRHQPQLEIITAKPLMAGVEETAANPRARSAKLRAARKI